MNPATDWIDQARGLLDLLRQNAAGPEDGGPHGADCRWCPVCQAAAVIRGERPEVTTALADVLTAAAVALRTLAEADRPAPPGARPDERSAERSEAGPDPAAGDGSSARVDRPGDSTPVVQRIEIA